MADIAIKIEDKKLRAWLKKNEKQVSKEASIAVYKTSGYTKRLIGTRISKRSGNLAKSYKVKKIDRMTSLVYTNVKYAEAVESGYKAHIIKPKNKKVLTIPLNNSVLTKSGAQIQKGKLDSLFKGLKKARGKEAKRQIMDKVGIAITPNPVKIPAFKGTHAIRTKIMPSIQVRFMREMKQAIKRSLRV